MLGDPAGERFAGERIAGAGRFQDAEGAKFWMQVLTELKARGVADILICCVDGLKGFPEAIEAIYPATTVQTCIVHLIRASLKYVPRKQYDAVPQWTRTRGWTKAMLAFKIQFGDRIPD